MQSKDKFGRTHDYLRISLTDKCNLNCSYCNPVISERELHKEEILSYEELLRLIKIFVVNLSYKKIRLTGGEPLVRKNILTFFESIHKIKTAHPFELCLTTNGTLLEDKIEKLKEFGLNKINISLDSLRPERFFSITSVDNFHSVLRSIDKAESLGFSPVKINTVVMRGINDDEVIDFVEFAKNRNLNVRFIEFMPFSNNRWNESIFISNGEILKAIQTKYRLEELDLCEGKVAKDFKISDHKGKVSFISSISDHFCQSCNRLRVTAKGNLKLCLFSQIDSELSLISLLRNSLFSDDAIASRIAVHLHNKKLTHPDIDKLILLQNNNMLSIGG